jgi:hypothetical protein
VVPMRTLAQATGLDAIARARAMAGPILVWAVWGAMTVATILFIGHYSRNVPFMDDFLFVPLMSGQESLSPRWLWTQHNEHRAVVSRLIIAGLLRFIARDFRLPLYFNAALLSGAAASMLVLVRKLRGHTSLVDVALPLSILNLGQAETLLIGFAMNLTLTSWISCELIRLASARDSQFGLPLSLKLGLSLLLLPLCGGSGLIMLPPLLLWLVCDSIWGCAADGDPARAKVSRAIGVALLVICLGVVAFYMVGYERPPHHPLPVSFAAVVFTFAEYLSLAVWPIVLDYGRVAGLIVAVLVAATLARLCWVGCRQPAERARAFAMLAVILGMLCAAVAVGVARSFSGAKFGRYVTTTAPLFCALYVAWLVHGPARARRFVHVTLFAVVVLTVPPNIKYGLGQGAERRAIYTRVERGMKSHSTITEVAKKAWPVLLPTQNIIETYFRMLKEARVGWFGNLVDDSRAPTQGWLDAVVVDSSVMVLSGWAAGLHTGPVDGFKVSCGRKVFTEFAMAKAPSADVEAVFPELDQAGTCRFQIRIPLTESDRAEVRSSNVICTPLVGGREGFEIVGQFGSLADDQVAQGPSGSSVIR